MEDRAHLGGPEDLFRFPPREQAYQKILYMRSDVEGFPREAKHDMFGGGTPCFQAGPILGNKG